MFFGGSEIVFSWVWKKVLRDLGFEIGFFEFEARFHLGFEIGFLVGWVGGLK
jgi:hypothetical protein